MTAEPLGFSRVAVGYLSYHREFMLPLVLAHKSLIFHSRFEEELEVRSSHWRQKRPHQSLCAGPNVHLKTRQKSRGCIPDSPWSQASSRGEAKDSALLSSRDTGLLEPTEWLKGSQTSSGVWREDTGLLSRQCMK